MKTIINKTGTLQKPGFPPIQSSYRELMTLAINHVDPKVGVTVSENRKRIKLLDKIEESFLLPDICDTVSEDQNGIAIKLEDADFSALVDYVKKWPSAITGKFIDEFAQALGI